MKNLSRFAPPLLSILLLSSPAFAADASDADIAALKAQIALLAKKVDQLQAEAKQAKAATPAPSTLTTPASPASLPPSSYDSAKSMPVTPPPANAVSAGDYVTKGSFPGSFHIPGTDTSVKIGGYVKLDAVEDIGEGYGASFAKFYAIPLKGTVNTQQGNSTTFGAQQSRLNVETRTATGLGELRTVIEGDFFNTSAPTNSNINGYGLQLRHAFGSVGDTSTGQVLAGQTWSNFHDEGSRPESLDYVGPAGTVFVRQPQIRYTHDVGPVMVAASVEAPLGGSGTAAQDAVTNVTSTGGTAVGATNTSGQGKMPDITLRGDYKYAPNSYVALRLVGSQINVDHATSGLGNNDTATKYGYGIALSGNNAFANKDSVLYTFVYGDGTGRYVYDINQYGNYYNGTTGQLSTSEYLVGTLGYQHIWSEQFRSNFFGGVLKTNNDTAFTNLLTGTLSPNKYVASGHANLIWQPAPAYKIGIEYMHGYRKTENGIEGQLNRTEASFIYGF